MILVRADKNFSGTLSRTCWEHVLPKLYVVVVVIRVHMTKTNTQLTMVSRSQKEKVGLMHLDDFRASLYGETLVLCGVLDCLLAATFLWFPCVSCNTTMIFNSFAMLMTFIKFALPFFTM